MPRAPRDLRIRHEPQDCATDCGVPDCHYSHGDTWWIGYVPFFTLAAAEAALAEEDETERRLTAGLDTLTNRS